MSKAALADLAQRLKGDSKEFRNKVINKQVHMVDTKATSITKQLREEIARSSPEILKFLTDADLSRAASKFRANLMGMVSHSRYRGLSVLDTNPNIVVGNTYGTFSKALAAASEAAISYINTILTKRQADEVPFLSSKTVHLDHTRTVSETRIASDIHAAGIDPIKLVQELKNQKFITRKDLKQVYENILDINSYYSGDSKVFEVSGKVVQGALRSGTGNEDEGRSEVNARATAFRKAVQSAINSNKWDTQAASDSYREYVFKKLNNAVVKAGGTGKLRPVNTRAAKASSSSRTTSEISAIEVAPFGNIRSAGGKSRGSRPMIDLQTINDYINARLPPAIRANMGGARLHNRTGTFSESAKIVGAEVTPKGYPTLIYSYQRSPYDVFDPVLGKAPWNTPGRDPKDLIVKSIRDIAKDLAIGRFYVRRA